MGYELDSQVNERLRRNYAAMSDGELLALAARPGDLTEGAQQALGSEMAARKLTAKTQPIAANPENGETNGGRRWASDAFAQAVAGAPGITGSILGTGPVLEPDQPSESVGPGEVSLRVFHDAIEAGEACDALEAAGMALRVVDVATRREGMGIYDSPPVALSLIVAKKDRERAMSVLREKMGLFPLQEVEEADPVVDDGTVATLGSFARREDATEFEKMLDEARIWHRMVENPEGSAEEENAWTLEVREVDLVKAGDLVERAMGLS